MIRRNYRGVLSAAVLLVATAWAIYGSLGHPDPETLVSDRPVQLPEDGYVTSKTCQACHPSEYASWHASYHRTMTQLVTTDTVATDLDGVELEWEGVRYRFARDDDRYWVETRAPGDPAPRRRPVVMSTGSHAFQLYWAPSGSGRRLDIIPFHYVIDEGRWIPRDAHFLAPAGEHFGAGEWNTGCIHCHSTRGRPRVAGREQADTRVAEFGISCEACHGPAEDHVAINRNPVRRYRQYLDEDGGDASIVHPKRLDQRRSSQICGQCHGHSVPTPEARASVRDQGRRFRPGDELEETAMVVTLERFSDPAWEAARRRYPAAFDTKMWPDGFVRGSGRELGDLLGSPCYVRGEMTCLSCHTMHRKADDPRPVAEWADDQLGQGMDGDAACLQCHDGDAYTARIEGHTHHRVNSSGSRCYNCHNPYTTYGLLKAIRSHRVSSPAVAVSLKTGRPNACNQCHLDQTLAWSADHLERWYDQPAPALSDDQRTIAASALWLLGGDAAQRVLIAWSMGWEPARTASGTGWMAPYLAQLLEDPYPAVRYVAERSLGRLPGFERFEYDFVGPAAQRAEANRRARRAWSALGPSPARDALLIGADGALQRDVFERLLLARDDRRIAIAE